MVKQRVSASATKADLDGGIGSLRRDQASKALLARVILRLHKRIDRLEVNLIAEMREGTSRILQAIDAFTGEARNSERAAVLHGRALTDVQVGMKDHERRITTLEAR